MWQFFKCAMCHNFKPSLIIIMDDKDQYFKKNIMSKNIHNAICQGTFTKYGTRGAPCVRILVIAYSEIF